MNLPRYGFWSMLHEARTDLSMWLALLFLLVVEAGKWSFDAALSPEPTGLEPATSAVTGRRSNQLS